MILHLRCFFPLKVYVFYFMHMSVLLAYVYVLRVHAWCPLRPEEGTVSPGTGVIEAFTNHHVGPGN